MKPLKKILFGAISIITSLVMTTSLAYADEDNSVGNIIGINQDDADFDELFCVINGKNYMPIRLPFPNLNDRENKVGLHIGWDPEYPLVRLIYGSTTGELGVNGVPPFNGVRRCVDIFLWGDTKKDMTASLTVMEYTKDEDGRIHSDQEKTKELSLKDPVYLKPVPGGGDRLFVSSEDINTISELLQIDDTYNVKLYN